MLTSIAPTDHTRMGNGCYHRVMDLARWQYYNGFGWFYHHMLQLGRFHQFYLILTRFSVALEFLSLSSILNNDCLIFAEIPILFCVICVRNDGNDDLITYHATVSKQIITKFVNVIKAIRHATSFISCSMWFSSNGCLRCSQDSFEFPFHSQTQSPKKASPSFDPNLDIVL